jgi:hypothetical protein
MSICEACINCEREWSAGRGVSCHDTCDDYLAWRKEVKREVASWTPVHVPGAL